MRKFLLLTMMCVIGLFTVNAQETITVGNKTTTDASIPTHTWYNYSYSQQIYTAEEINHDAGNISKIAFLTNNTSYERSIKVYMQNTTKDVFSSASDWIAVTDADLVYDGKVKTTSVMEIVLDKQFEYTGGNLLLCVQDYTKACPGTTSFDIMTMAEENKCVLFINNDPALPGPGSEVGTSNIVNRKNVIQLTFGELGEVEEPSEEPEDSELPENLYIVEVGADKTPNAQENYYLPVYDYGYSMSQQIYTADDLLGNTGNIHSVAFKLGNSRTPVTREYEVYITSTELNTFDGDNFVALSENDKVFDGNVEISGTIDTWYTINFTTPFNYTGGNIVLTVYDKTSSSTGYHLNYKFSAEGRALYQYGSSEIDMLNLTTGTSLSYVNQVKFGMAAAPAVNVTPASVTFGTIALGSWSENASVEVEVTAVNTTITNIAVDNDFFVLPEVIDYTADPVTIEVTYNRESDLTGEVEGNIIISYAGTTKELPISANIYTPSVSDVYELAQEITFTEDAYTNTPEFETLVDNYNLPNEVNAGNTPDAVYTFELESEATVMVNVTGTNAVAAIYAEDFAGEGGPKADNDYKGIIPAKTTFFYDFQNQSLEDFTLIDKDNDGKNWEITEASGNSFVISFSNNSITPNNYMVTKEAYAITGASKLTYSVRGVNGYQDYYAIVVSEDGENFDDIFGEVYAEATFKTVEVDLSAYADKELYIGLHHYNCSNQYYVAIDDLKLTDGSGYVRMSNAEPQIKVSYPAGKYYLVVAAEDAFTVDVNLDIAPPAAPEELVATAISETSISLDWSQVEGVDGYYIYKDEEFFVTAAANVTEYRLENLEPNTVYCFTVTSVKNDIESFKSKLACAKTLDYIIAAPTNVAVTAVDAYAVKLTWDAVEYAQSYNVYINNELAENLTATSYTLEDLTPSTEYCFEVSAVRNDHETEKVNACGSTTAINFDDENLPTEFFYDFNDRSLVDFEFIDADGDGRNWEASFYASGYNDTYAIRSYSSSGTDPIHPDNYIYTKRPYRITSSSVVTLNAKCGNGMEIDLGEHYAVMVSENGTEWQVVFEETIEHADWTNTIVSLEAYAGKALLIGVRHNQSTGLYFLGVDNFRLTTSPVDDPEQPVDPENPGGDQPGGDEPEQPVDPEQPGDEPETPVDPETPADSTQLATLVVTATATSDTTIVLTWNAIDSIASYNVYMDTVFVVNVTDTTYTVTGLTANTQYCFTVAAVNDTIELAKSEAACATTLVDAIDELASSFSIYPNPVNDKLYIETLTQTQTLTVEIYDMFGRQQSTVNGQQTSCIDVTNLNSGIYFVKVVTDNGEVVKRFVKK